MEGQPMAKKQRSNRGSKDADDTKYATLYELFELPDDEDDSKGYLLTWAEALAGDSKVSLQTLIARALHHFLREHGSEFQSNPETYRIPTQEEDDELERISMAIGYLDPRPKRNFHSPGFRPDIALDGWEFAEGEEE
jgi:hypothetical protein